MRRQAEAELSIPRRGLYWEGVSGMVEVIYDVVLLTLTSAIMGVPALARHVEGHRFLEERCRVRVGLSLSECRPRPGRRARSLPPSLEGVTTFPP